MNKKVSLWTKQFIGIACINIFLFTSSQLQLSTLPVYIFELTGSDYIVGISVSISTAAALLARPFAGMAIDRLGRKKLLLTGIILLMSALFLYTVFKIIAVILAIRFIFGLGWGISTTSSNTIASDSIPHSRFGEGMGYFSLSQSLSLALAPLIGLTLLEIIEFRGLCILSIGLLLTAVIISNFLTYKKLAKHKEKMAAYEKSAVKPAVIMAFIGIGMSSTFGFAMLYGNSMNFNNVGLFFTFYAVVLFVTRPLTGKLIDKFGFSASIIPGFIGFIASMLVLSFWQKEAGFLTAAVIQGFSYGTLQTSIQTMAVVNSPTNRRGAANATYFTGFDAGIGAGSFIAGTLSANFGYSSMYGIMSIFIAVGMLIFLLISKKEKDVSDEIIDKITEETSEDMTTIDM